LQLLSDSAKLREARVKEHWRFATDATKTFVAVLSLALLGPLRLKPGVIRRGNGGYKQQ
jgi:hypothetical protein